MKKIFAGLFFVLLDFNVRIPSGNENVFYIIGLLPTFIGCILIALGLKSLVDKNNFFAMGQKVAWVMSGVTFVNYVLNASGFAFRIPQISLILSVFVVLGTLAVPFFVARGAKEEELKSGEFWNARQMMKFWTFYAVFVTLQNILMFVPIAEMLLLVMIGTYVTVGSFLFAVYKVRNIA